MTANIIRDPNKNIEMEEAVWLMATSGTTALGDVMAVNPLLLKKDGVTGSTAASSGGEYAVMRVPLAADIDNGWIGVAQRSGLNGEIIPFRFQSYVVAKVNIVAQALAIGDPLYCVNNSRLLATDSGVAADAHAKVVAKCMEVVASTTAVQLVKVCLMGINPFGVTDHA